MSSAMWSKERARKISKRLVITGNLVLETPAHFGNGDSDESVLALQTDSVDPSKPLLPGPSVAGALRNYLRVRALGFNKAEDTGKKAQDDSTIAQLFGAPLGGLTDSYGGQSLLLIDDAVGEAKGVDYRDGVRIDPISRTAIDQGLYTFQTWAAGTTFPLRLELLITEKMNETRLKRTLATALQALENGEITLGARKKRGLGRGRVDAWMVREYDMKDPSHIYAWLKGEAPQGGEPKGKAAEVLGGLDTTDERRLFTIEVTFEVDGSVLIRSGSEVADMAHLKSNGKSVISGTSLAGAIRARARKIVNTLGKSPSIVEEMFGRDGDAGERSPSPSRVIIREAVIDGGESGLVQSRVSIDRFTGGALDTALFTQQPHWGGTVTLNIELRNPMESEIGLLLLVLKDLWTGDLPIGGESSVGRGRLRGISGTLDYNGQQWTLNNQAGLTVDGDTHLLERFVQSLNQVEEGSHA